MKNRRIHLMMATLILGGILVSNIVPSVLEVKAEVVESAESEAVKETSTSTEVNSSHSVIDTEVSSSSSMEIAETKQVLAKASIPAPKSTKTVAGLVPATPEEIEAANNAANVKVGFDPLVNVKTANNWTDFRTYYNDQTVTKIMMTGDIVRGTGTRLADRAKSIEIDGGGFVLDIGGETMRMAASPNDGIGFYHFHDLEARNGQNGGSAGTNWAFVNGVNGTTYSRNWRFRTGNIKTSTTGGQHVARLIRGTRAEITVYGKLNLITTAENFYAGSIVIEDGTDWYGEDTNNNYSVIWYELNSSGTDTGAEQLFQIGKNSRVVLKNSTSGTTYPAVYSYYQHLSVGEGSIYNANMNGNAVRFDRADSHMTIKDGAVVNLLSRGNGEVLQYSANNSNLTVEAGGSLYVVGNTTGGVVNLQGAGGHTLTLDNPAGFDIRNNHNSGRALSMNNATNVFTINSSDIDLWNVGSAILGPSQETYALVDNFSVKNGGGAANVTTSEPSLSNFTVNKYRRIAGMNSKPEVQWSPVTDADKSYKAKVLIGYTPGDTYDEFGNVILQPVYASANQAKVTYTDTFGETHEAFTGNDGYAVFTDTRFNEANKDISAIAVRGPWVSEEAVKTTVIDITPPEPAKVDNEDRVSPISKELAGTGEVNANVSFTLNGIAQPALTTVVDNEGKWKLSLPDGLLKQDDKLQIFLQDTAGKAEIANPPITNSDVGNINPVTDLKYSDATFKAAKIVSVNGILTMTSAPANVSFGSVNVLDFTQSIGVDRGNIDTELIVEDTRGAREKWDLTAQVVEEMTNDGDELVGAMKYYFNNDLLTLTKSPQTIYTNGANDPKLTYNITDGWGKADDQNGLKFQAKGDVVPKTNGSYTGTVKWTLRDTIE